MNKGLTAVSDAQLQRLRDSIANGQLPTPITRATLTAFGIRNQLDALVTVLEGHSRQACLSILSSVLAERDHLRRPMPELVWTGPEGHRATARDTAVVLRELFEKARKCVVLAGYSFTHAKELLTPLHHSMKSYGVEVFFIVNIEQTSAPQPNPEKYGQAKLTEFIQANWSFGTPYPRLYCDRRALLPGPLWASLHSKCVVVDAQLAFVSSANFTQRGQERNIETGVLLNDPLFAAQLERQWLGLIGGGFLLEWVNN
jgi:phosphatidylserine/phosphatidylglycerophosphate/cardiolipin synthase-like enzyme